MNGYRRQINKERRYIYIYIYIHTVEYYSAIKKNVIMPFSATQIDLEIIILKKEVRKRHLNTI